MSGPVVVGVDGSESGLAAVEAAAGVARSRGVELRVVHAFVWPLMHVPLGAPVPGPADGGLRNAAERVLADAAGRARSLAPEVKVTEVLVAGAPLPVLEAQSRTAGLVVVGSRGLGAFTGLLIGSTAVGLAAHGGCPGVGGRGRPAPDGPIVLGVDGSAAGDEAVGFAFDEADSRGAGIVALHAWTPWDAPMPPPGDPSAPFANEPGALAEHEARLPAEALAGWCAKYPDIRVEHRVVRADAREALIEASAAAQLVVVGTRGRGGFAGLLLGSVSQALLHHAHCPVVVAGGS
ncbi:universal stress protein [Streptomyces specialis]|uniref:universal stress protein n=1 Tax=Streptomyces specialis TaxID=498367 RepID=UPI00073E2C9C|nr:universal stress protein [Streptomyces specialis]